MKYIFMALAITALSGCGYADRVAAHVTGYSEICVKNVEYIQFASGASVEYDTNGKVVTCK